MEPRMPSNEEIEAIISEIAGGADSDRHGDKHAEEGCPACRMYQHLADCESWCAYLIKIIRYDSLFRELVKIPPIREQLITTMNFFGVFCLLIGMEVGKRQVMPDMETLFNVKPAKPANTKPEEKGDAGQEG